MPHIHALYDFTVSGFIVFEGQVLLLHHKKLDTWLQPGGHIELNEDPEEALFREIEEETGLTRPHLKVIEPGERALPFQSNERHKRLPLPFDLNVHPFGDHPTHRHIDLSYLMQSDTGSINQNLAESNDLRWFTRKELEAHQSELLPDIYSRAIFALDSLS